jgi:autotransporter family porin
MVPRLLRAVYAWSIGLLVLIMLAAGCTSEGQGPTGSHGPFGDQGPSGSQESPEDQGPSDGQEQDFGTLPVGAHLPSGQECAARVQRDQQEPRPENTSANQFVPDRVSMPIWTDFTEEANRQLVSRIDGNFTGTTGDILTWGACKWGLDADVLKAVAVQESDWRQSTVSDESNKAEDCVGGATPPCPTSFGIMQLKDIALPGSYPLSEQSTAFNVDYYGARIRACYEGWVTYLHDDYGPGDLRDCVGWHWSGHWKDAGAQRYIQRVDRYLDSKPWLNWSSEHH